VPLAIIGIEDDSSTELMKLQIMIFIWAC